ncbi:LINE-1 reverse transcriptase-like protein [Smittium culicis]|uniref:LINE-1 reverse transcriptase-like protein n=1 Tax=Smittium culicis TaxID=133412 RepID=A0A1R1XGP5_9FUNG|nr:LINE-1 reverse transcriptase-like protein [Smittium culicis]
MALEPQQGLRQGVPLSPLFDNLIIETLILLVKERISGITVSNEGFKILAYADDLLIGINNRDEEKKLMKH